MYTLHQLRRWGHRPGGRPLKALMREVKLSPRSFACLGISNMNSISNGWPPRQVSAKCRTRHIKHRGLLYRCGVRTTFFLIVQRSQALHHITALLAVTALQQDKIQLLCSGMRFHSMDAITHLCNETRSKYSNIIHVTGLFNVPLALQPD